MIIKRARAAGSARPLSPAWTLVIAAVLASVFSRPGAYSSASTFVTGFSSALWVAVALSFAGILLTLPVRRPARLGPQPDPAEAGPLIPALPVN